MKYSFDELIFAKDVVGVFYVILVDLPFSEYEEEITECRRKLKWLIPIVSERCEKYSDLCRIYDLYLRFKEIKFKKKKIWKQLNACNFLMRWIDKFYKGDIDNWYLQAPHWQDYYNFGKKTRWVYIPYAEKMIEKVRKCLNRYL